MVNSKYSLELGSNVKKRLRKEGTWTKNIPKTEKWKYWPINVAYKVHTQRTLLEYRATIHYATGITLASLSFGCYSRLLLFLCPLISWRGLFAASWRRLFGLFLSVAILWLLLRWYSITDPGAEMSGIWTLWLIGVIIFPFAIIINFAELISIWTLESSRRDLHNAPLCTVLQSQNFSQKSSTFFRDWIIEFPIFFIFFVEFCIFSANFWWIFFRISRQIPEKSDVCRFSINFAKTN